MKERGMISNQWDEALDSFDANRQETGGSDAWLRANHPDTVDDRRAFYEATPWNRFRASLTDRIEKRRVRRRLGLSLWFSGLGVTASAIIAALILWPAQGTWDATGDVPASTIRVKGGQSTVETPVVAGAPSLRVYSGSTELSPGAHIPADATLQFRVNTFQFDHVIVFSVEQNGRIVPHYPDLSDGHSELVGQGKGIPLPDGIRLDGHPAQYRFVAVFSKGPLAWRTVREAAERALAEGATAENMQSLGLESTGEAVFWFDTYQ